MAILETDLTLAQKDLLDTLWKTETVAPVGRRRQNSDGSYKLYKFTRPTRPIDFPVPGSENEEFALKLHETNIETILSPHYINLRSLPLGVLARVSCVIADATYRIGAELCTGIPDAGKPITEVYSQITGLPFRIIFAKANNESGRKIVVNPYASPTNSRLRLLLLDDLITEAGTKFEAIEAAESLGYKIAGVAVLVDRQQGGVEQLKSRGYQVFAPLPVSKIFEYYLTTGKIDWGRYNSSMGYLNEIRIRLSLPTIPLLEPCT